MTAERPPAPRGSARTPSGEASGGIAPGEDPSPERYGEVTLLRHRKGDARGLILYTRAESPSA